MSVVSVVLLAECQGFLSLLPASVSMLRVRRWEGMQPGQQTPCDQRNSSYHMMLCSAIKIQGKENAERSRNAEGLRSLISQATIMDARALLFLQLVKHVAWWWKVVNELSFAFLVVWASLHLLNWLYFNPWVLLFHPYTLWFCWREWTSSLVRVLAASNLQPTTTTQKILFNEALMPIYLNEMI